MDWLVQFLSNHADYAHWIIFFSLLLAGCNLPISIDALVILSAVLAVQYIPEHTILLYCTLLIGCSLSAWISYGIGRWLGPKLENKKLFSSLFSEKKRKKLQFFYQKYGPFAFIIGRFIPFGARNCLFMTSGLSRMSFWRFILLDAIACFIWVTSSFLLFFHLGQNFDRLWEQVKSFNLLVFFAFAMAVISVIWYKYNKKKPTPKETSHIN